jgi:acetyltransferase-like isoleucine patch superfamily enzyme
MFINDAFRQGYPAEDSSLWDSTEVGDGVSIGSNATILPVKIGDGSVIGAGSVVTRDIPPNVVVAGNPAKVIRRL